MIETRGLAHAYAGGPRLAFPDLTVAQGETLVLRGPSGSGKSTWLALAAGLLHPGDGEIMVAGQSPARLNARARDAWRGRHLALLPQRLHLSAALTVRQNLELVYFAAGLPVDHRAIGRMLNALSVAELAPRRPGQLSGGQAQRVALARALLREPCVILADEPTASLDDTACEASLALMREHADRCDATLVIATHDRRVIEALPEARELRLGPLTSAAASPARSAPSAVSA
jgi:putative ABC transport system ATP-binding protein